MSSLVAFMSITAITGTLVASVYYGLELMAHAAYWVAKRGVIVIFLI